jgi:hypothetical protein
MYVLFWLVSTCFSDSMAEFLGRDMSYFYRKREREREREKYQSKVFLKSIFWPYICILGVQNRLSVVFAFTYEHIIYIW